MMITQLVASWYFNYEQVARQKFIFPFVTKMICPSTNELTITVIVVFFVPSGIHSRDPSLLRPATHPVHHPKKKKEKNG